MSTQPFTYFLRHIPTGMKYYGVRYCRGCSPTDLWTKYFSSSTEVKRLIKEYGVDSFIYEVRKVFESPEAAKLWESKVQRRLRVDMREDWLNKHVQSSKFRGVTSHKEETKIKIKKKMLGRSLSDEHKKKISEKSLIDRQRRRHVGWKMPRDAIEKSIQWRKDNRESFYTEERNRRMAESKKGTKRYYLPDGSFVMLRPNQEDQ